MPPPLLNVVRRDRREAKIPCVLGVGMSCTRRAWTTRAPLERVDGIETQSGTKQCSIGIEALRLDASRSAQKRSFGKSRCFGCLHAAMLYWHAGP